MRSLMRHEAFWSREQTDRPLLGFNLGMSVYEHCPSTFEHMPVGPVDPDDIRTDLFLEDCERLYRAHRELDDDYPFVASPFVYIPWMEAIMGCPVTASPISVWAEPCVADWETWRWPRPTVDDPWARKLLELMQALVEHSRGRYPVAGTMMRGPADMLAAMRGASRIPLDFIDCPEIVTKAIELCTDVWIEIGKAQHALIPDSEEGYMDGDRGLRFWAPDRAIWLQEDAAALLSPRIYREFVLPSDRRITAEFPAVAFHLHDTGMWALDDLLADTNLDVIELNLEAANTDIEATFRGWKKIYACKPLIIWRNYEEGFWPWLDRVLDEFPPRGLSLQITVRNVEEGKEVKRGFEERIQARYEIARAQGAEQT